MIIDDPFEEQNINNLIEFHKKELKLLYEGASIDDVFNSNERRKLRKLGVLHYSNSNWYITEKVKEIIFR